MLTVQHLHRAMKDAGFSCALRRFPTSAAAGLPTDPIPGYRISREEWGWKVAQIDSEGREVPASPDYLRALKASQIACKRVRGAIRIEVAA